MLLGFGILGEGERLPASGKFRLVSHAAGSLPSQQNFGTYQSL